MCKYDYSKQYLFFILLINDVYLPELLLNPVPAKYLLYDNFILGKECDPIPHHPPTFWWSGGGSDQWGRRLEILPNTAARLAGWGRVTHQVWFCMWWTDHIACLFRTVPELPGCELTEFPAGTLVDTHAFSLVLNTKNLGQKRENRPRSSARQLVIVSAVLLLPSPVWFICATLPLSNFPPLSKKISAWFLYDDVMRISKTTAIFSLFELSECGDSVWKPDITPFSSKTCNFSCCPLKTPTKCTSVLNKFLKFAQVDVSWIKPSSSLEKPCLSPLLVFLLSVRQEAFSPAHADN